MRPVGLRPLTGHNESNTLDGDGERSRGTNLEGICTAHTNVGEEHDNGQEAKRRQDSRRPLAQRGGRLIKVSQSCLAAAA